MAAGSPTLELLRSVQRDAMHLELRDVYTPDDPDWLAWQAGDRRDLLAKEDSRWWFDLIVDIVGRGARVRRARVVSEPVTDYIRFEHAVTAGFNVKAGELVRWLPRHQSAGLTVPPSDFWVFDERVVVWNHFAGDGTSRYHELSEDEAVAKLCAASFEAVWERAVPHEEYRIT